MLYMAALTVLLRTVFEFLDAQPTWMGCAVISYLSLALGEMVGI